MIKTVHDSLYESLLLHLKDARLKQGLTVRDLGLKIDEPFQFVSKVETGQRRLNVYEYVQYCEALGLDPHTGIRLLAKNDQGASD